MEYDETSMNRFEQYSLIGVLVMVIIVCTMNKRTTDLLIITSTYALSYVITKNWYYSLLVTILVYCVFYNSQTNYITEGMTDKKIKQRKKRNLKQKIKKRMRMRMRMTKMEKII